MHRDVVVGEFTYQAESFARSAVAHATLEPLVAMAAPVADERWLDVCCGPGLVANALAGRAASVHGIDTTPAMVAAARAAEPAATFSVGDATALDVEPGFDGVVSRFALHHVPLPGRMVDEMARVTRSGGKVVLCDHVADEDPDAYAWAQEVERLRDPSHWASLTVGRARLLGAGLELEAEEILPISLDLDDWIARGSGDPALVETALAARPGGTACFRVRARTLGLRLWLSRWRVP